MLRLEAGDYRLAVEPERGGSIAAFRWRGRPLLRESCGPSILDTGCFPLVPFSNRIAHGRFAAGGREVVLPANFPAISAAHPLHGFGWLAAWTVAEEAPGRLVLHHDHPGGAWPWPYRACQTFELSPDGLSVTLDVANLGDSAMPAGLGFHPYFPRDPDTVYAGLHRGEWRTDAEGLPVALDEAAQAKDWWAGRPVGTRAVDTVYTGRDGPLHIRWPASGHALTIAPSSELDCTVVYAPADGRFFCVEPVSHATDAVRAGGMRWLAPGDALGCAMRLRAEDLSARQ